MKARFDMLNSILESKSIYFAKTNLNGEYTFLNDHFCDRLGVDRTDLIGIQFARHTVPEDYYKCTDAFKQCIDNPNISHKVVLRMPLSKKGFITCEWEFISLSESADANEEILCIGYDITEKEFIEKNLFAANQRLSTYMYNSPLGIVEYEQDLTIRQWSKRSEEIFGWTQEEILNKSFGAFDIIHEGDIESTTKVAEELLQGIVNGNISQNRNKTKNGKTIHCVWYNSVIKDETGAVQSVLSLVQDVTSRVEDEESIRVSEKRFRALIENGKDAVAIFSADGALTYVTPSVTKVLGYEEEEILKLNIIELVHSDDVDSVRSAFQRVMKAPGIPMPGHTSRMKHKDGSWRWIEATITNLTTDPHIAGIVNNFRDVTDQVENEMLITKTNRHLQRAQNISNIGYWELNLKSRANFWSEEMFLICGVDEKKGVPPIDDFFKMIHPEDLTYVQNKHLLVMESKQTIHMEYRLIKGENDIIYVKAIASCIQDEHGKAIALEGTLQDITERKNEEVAMRNLLDRTTDQNKRLKDFSFMTSHNIRSSVANIMGLTSILENGTNNADCIELIKTATEHLDTTVKNISELLNFENEFTSTHIVDCRVKNSIQRTLSLNSAIISTKDVFVELSIPPELTVKSIPAYLDSIFHNLITNAIKYGITDTARQLRVVGRKEENKVIIEIQDFGIGINLEDDSGKLFKLGSRLHQSSEGQGLGLYMTKHQIEAMGGKIEVKSKVGYGTTFTVILNE
ncbi:MAG: PAS domain-containing sensor histidine kinase [Cyclobacteriaceae bacterium]